MRSRLTLLYGGLFLLAGGILIAILYIIFTTNFPGGHLAEGIFPLPGKRSPPPGPGLTQAEVQNFGRKLNQHRSEIISSLLWESLLALAVVAVAAVGFGWLMAGRALRAVRHITDTARRVAGSNLQERIALAGPRDELKELADTFDAMLERLDASFDGQRHFAASASHELRTPLATNRTLLEVAVAQHRVPAELRQVIDTVLATSTHSELILDGLLTLARCDNQAIDRLPVDLSDVAAGAVEETAAEAAAAGVTVNAAPDPAPTTGDPILLERLALNLVHNGIQHNQRGGWVRVTTRTAAAPGLVELEVSNSGPLVPPDQADTLFEPFRRLGDNRTGHPHGAGRPVHRPVYRQDPWRAAGRSRSRRRRPCPSGPARGHVTQWVAAGLARRQRPSSASWAARWPAWTAPSMYPLQALAVSVAAHLIGPIGLLKAAPKWIRPHGPVFEL
jgi:signal transduction histidine kinase